ncbi:MAG: hypothetical protein AB1578_20905 [Thermodesulfobacteriota bacterium]
MAGQEKAKGSSQAAADFLAKVKAHEAERKTSRREAMDAVIAAEPKLYQEWLDAGCPQS